MRALIVDDSGFARGRLRVLLEERRIDCVEAGDGRAALEILRVQPEFDLAFVDWHMPVMNGLEMLKEVRSDKHRDLKICMVTTEGDKARILRALSAGADEYMMKPFDRESLSEKLALLGIEEPAA